MDDALRPVLRLAARASAKATQRVSTSQLQALLVLQERGPMNLTALADELGAIPSSATRLCDRLVAADLITRETGQSKQNVGKYLALAALPKYLIAAFRDERRMSLRWSSDLSQLVQTRGETLEPVAAELAQRAPAPSPEAVFAELMRARPRPRAAVEVIHLGEEVAFELSGSRRRVQLKVGKALKPREVRALKGELKGWLEQWQRNGWKTAAKQPVKNQDLWQRLAEEAGRHRVRFELVRGHAGVELNERADQLAVAERDRYAVSR